MRTYTFFPYTRLFRVKGPEAVFLGRDRDVRPDPGGLSDERQPWRRTQYAAGLAAAAEELAALVQQRNPGAKQPCLALGADGGAAGQCARAAKGAGDGGRARLRLSAWPACGQIGRAHV